MENKLFGAKALVLLKYNGSISDLARLLAEKLQLSDIYIDTDSEAPYEEFGMLETLGFEIWLNTLEAATNFNYILKVESYLDVEDEFKYDKFDISPWLATVIKKNCEIETSFYNNKIDSV